MSKKLIDIFSKYNGFGIGKALFDMPKPLKEMQKNLSVLNKFNNSFIDNVNRINNNNFVKGIKEIQKSISAHNINSISPQFNDLFKNIKGIHYYNNMSKNILFTNTDVLINNMKLNNMLDGYSEDDIEEVRDELKSDLLDIKENVIK